MGHSLKLKCAHSPLNLSILSPTSVPFSLTTLQMPNLALVETKLITVHNAHSCVCERFIYSHDRSAYSAARKYVDRSWEYIDRSQTHKCGNWDWGRAILRKGIHKWDFHCSACLFRLTDTKSVYRSFAVYSLYDCLPATLMTNKENSWKIPFG